jgi:N-acetyl-gamma-glutamyl-phosphate reductase
MTKVFIDGSSGTTGLRIHERLGERSDIELITVPYELRHEPEVRKDAIAKADVAFLCLPDDAAREAVAMIENESVTVIDTSTAHRTLDGWCYGFPELSDELDERLKSAKRIAVPGCHASGFIALVKPLIDNGFIDENELLTCHSITGYSGGGKKMIADYESEERDSLLDAPRQYAITQQHKHLKEMQAITGLKNAPVFCPIVSDFYSGMTVTVPLFASQLKAGKTAADIKKLYAEKYNTDIVSFYEAIDNGGFISAASLKMKDSMKITVAGNEERILLVALYDNLGKGASGAAIECMNIALGEEKTRALDI